MNDQLPEAIELCFRQSAERFGRSLKVLNWPNGGKDAPPHEANALINLWFYLGQMDQPFELYAEGTINENCRVDMIGFNGDTAIAVEAKGFGDINKRSEKVLDDLNRLMEFRPSLSDLKGKVDAQAWWDNAKHRWAIILIASFRGREVRDAWMSDDEAEIIRIMNTYTTASQRALDGDGNARGYLTLLREVPVEYRRSWQITPGDQWENTAEGWMLWAAVPIERSAVVASLA